MKAFKFIFCIAMVFVLSQSGFADNHSSYNAFFIDGSDAKSCIISGTVYDLKGNEAIAGAIVRIGNISTITDLRGEYTIADLPKGKYTLIVDQLSYKKKEIEIDLCQSIKLDVEIER